MKKTEIVVGDFKAVRADSMNWQMFERREIDAKSGSSRAGEVDWMPLPAFFGTLGAALSKMRQLHDERGLDGGALDEALGQLAKLDEAFTRELKRVLKAVDHA